MVDLEVYLLPMHWLTWSTPGSLRQRKDSSHITLVFLLLFFLFCVFSFRFRQGFYLTGAIWLKK